MLAYTTMLDLLIWENFVTRWTSFTILNVADGLVISLTHITSYI